MKHRVQIAQAAVRLRFVPRKRGTWIETRSAAQASAVRRDSSLGNEGRGLKLSKARRAFFAEVDSSLGNEGRGLKPDPGLEIACQFRDSSLGNEGRGLKKVAVDDPCVTVKYGKDNGEAQDIRPFALLVGYAPEFNTVGHLRDGVREKFFNNLVYDAIDVLEDELEACVSWSMSTPKPAQSSDGYGSSIHL